MQKGGKQVRQPVKESSHEGKSLLYNLFMKYLGEDGEEEEAKQETPLSDHGGDDKQEHMQDGGEAIPQETDGELSEQPDIPRKTEPEPLIETVEDWNEAELQKQRELDARSRGAEEPDSDEMPAEPGRRDRPIQGFFPGACYNR